MLNFLELRSHMLMCMSITRGACQNTHPRGFTPAKIFASGMSGVMSAICILNKLCTKDSAVPWLARGLNSNTLAQGLRTIFLGQGKWLSG